MVKLHALRAKAAVRARRARSEGLIRASLVRCVRVLLMQILFKEFGPLLRLSRFRLLRGLPCPVREDFA